MANTKMVPDLKEDPRIIVITESMVETERAVYEPNLLIGYMEYFGIE